jgi:uncharacterized protein YqgQ
MGIANLFKKLNTNIEAMELELSQAYEQINILEGELAHVQAENADLRDEMEAMNAALNQPSYD